MLAPRAFRAARPWARALGGPPSGAVDEEVEWDLTAALRGGRAGHYSAAAAAAPRPARARAAAPRPPSQPISTFGPRISAATTLALRRRGATRLTALQAAVYDDARAGRDLLVISRRASS